jgi:hypothetical protein
VDSGDDIEEGVDSAFGRIVFARSRRELQIDGVVVVFGRSREFEIGI